MITAALIAAASLPDPQPRKGTVVDQHGSVFCSSCLTRLTDRTMKATEVRDCPMGCTTSGATR